MLSNRFFNFQSYKYVGKYNGEKEKLKNILSYDLTLVCC